MYSVFPNQLKELKSNHFHPTHAGYDAPAYLQKQQSLFVFQIALPNFLRQDIQVNIRGEVMTIEGDHGKKIEQKPAECISKSVGFDCFKMQFHLSEALRGVEVTALFEQKILTITFHDVLAEQMEKVRYIEIF